MLIGRRGTCSPLAQTQWEAATWLLGAIGDANFLGRDFEAGRDSLSLAMHCPDAIGDPFLHLRLGQCQIELGNHRPRRQQSWPAAYMGSGGRDLRGRVPPRYFAFLKTRLDPPPGGW